jgi:transposase-like protein
MNLNDFYLAFPTNMDCFTYLESIFWKNIPKCSYCNYKKATKIKNSERYHCNICNTSFSVITKTIFHKTKVELQKWFYAIYLWLNSVKKISCRKLAKEIMVTKDTALLMLNRMLFAYKKSKDILERIIGNIDV